MCKSNSTLIKSHFEFYTGGFLRYPKDNCKILQTFNLGSPQLSKVWDLHETIPWNNTIQTTITITLTLSAAARSCPESLCSYYYTEAECYTFRLYMRQEHGALYLRGTNLDGIGYKDLQRQQFIHCSYIGLQAQCFVIITLYHSNVPVGSANTPCGTSKLKDEHF